MLTAQLVSSNLKGRTQWRELPLCAGSWEGCQWQALPSPVQCEETATRTRDLPVTGGKTLPLALTFLIAVVKHSCLCVYLFFS